MVHTRKRVNSKRHRRRTMRGGDPPGTPITDALRRNRTVDLPEGSVDLITTDEPFVEDEEVVVLTRANQPNERMSEFTVFKRATGPANLPPRRLDNSNYDDGFIARVHLVPAAAPAAAPAPAAQAPAAPAPAQAAPAPAPEGDEEGILIAVRPMGEQQFALVRAIILRDVPGQYVYRLESDELDPPVAFMRQPLPDEPPNFQFRVIEEDGQEGAITDAVVTPDADAIQQFLQDGGRKRKQRHTRRRNLRAKKTRKH